jgi:hypothetical protein
MDCTLMHKNVPVVDMEILSDKFETPYTNAGLKKYAGQEKPQK